MKLFFLTLTLSVFVCFFSMGQSLTPASNPILKRHVHFNYITKDSVNLSLNSEFELIEDSCSEVIRYTRIHLPGRKFFGPVKDVSKSDPELTLTEGTYSTDGLKEGSFITHYLNGNLQAKGNFYNNLYEGRWEIYNEDGKPKLTFEAHEKDIKVIDCWDSKGVKQVDQGKGNFRVELGLLYWQGKLVNGKPDGTWRAIKTDDATQAAVVTENFKNGLFVKGSDPTGAYKDSSRIVLVPADYLPFTRAEKMRISTVPCNGVKRKHMVRAQYSGERLLFQKRLSKSFHLIYAKLI
ncbi:MAG: toxin-antitoxin system YwqK family antitoxin [Janthinobacterium lividum]